MLGKTLKNIYRSFVAMLAGIVVFLGMGIAMAVPTAPSADSPVVDDSGTLTAEDISMISETIDNQNVDNRAQIAVYMTDYLPDGMSVEEASLEIAREWGIGSSNDKNGVLLYIAKDDRELRIEVADAAGEFLTDSESNRIIRNDITPSFKNGDFAGGINDGVSKIRAEVNGEIGAPAPPREPIDWSGFWNVMMWIGLVILALAIIFAVFMVIRKIVVSVKKKNVEFANLRDLKIENAKTITSQKDTISNLNIEVIRLNKSNSDKSKQIQEYKKMEKRLSIAENDPERFAKILKDEAEAERIRLEKIRQAEEARQRRIEEARIEAERKAEEERLYWASPEGKAEKKRIAEEKRRRKEEERKRREREEEERRERERKRREKREKEERDRRRRNNLYGSAYGSSFGSSSSSSSSSSSFGFGGSGGFNGGGSSGSW